MIISCTIVPAEPNNQEKFNLMYSQSDLNVIICKVYVTLPSNVNMKNNKDKPSVDLLAQFLWIWGNLASK